MTPPASKVRFDARVGRSRRRWVKLGIRPSNRRASKWFEKKSDLARLPGKGPDPGRLAADHDFSARRLEFLPDEAERQSGDRAGDGAELLHPGRDRVPGSRVGDL